VTNSVPFLGALLWLGQQQAVLQSGGDAGSRMTVMSVADPDWYEVQENI
jgi:hypothetical protein